MPSILRESKQMWSPQPAWRGLWRRAFRLVGTYWEVNRKVDKATGLKGGNQRFLDLLLHRHSKRADLVSPVLANLKAPVPCEPSHLG
jgi:hypothetical protein